MGTQPQQGSIGNEVRGDAASLAEAAKNRAFSEVDQRKGAATSQVKTVATALDNAAGELNDSPEWLRSAFRSGAQALQRLGDSVENKDARELGQEIQRLARQNPATFLGVCAAAGFAAARVLKAGSGGTSSSGGSWDQGSGYRENDDYSSMQLYGSEQASTYGSGTGQDDAGSPLGYGGTGAGTQPGYGQGSAGLGGSSFDDEGTNRSGTGQQGEAGLYGEQRQ